MRNVVPVITCSPWNIVAIKKIDPYVEYAVVSGASTYSYIHYNICIYMCLYIYI
jgi:hypothetical protein